MIEIQALRKSYNDIEVLNISALHIKPGSIFGLVGNNGAGKTTLFRCILDLIKPDHGTINSFDTSIGQSEDWKFFTGSFLDESFLIDFLSPQEYFEYVGNLRGLSKDELEIRLAEFNDFFNGEILDQRKFIRDLSKGNQKKVGIAAAMLGNLKVVLLDEPFANLDPTSVFRLKSTIKKHVQQNPDLMVLISSHDLNHVAELSTEICILNKGQIVKHVPTSEATLAELEAYFAV